MPKFPLRLWFTSGDAESIDYLAWRLAFAQPRIQIAAYFCVVGNITFAFLDLLLYAAFAREFLILRSVMLGISVTLVLTNSKLTTERRQMLGLLCLMWGMCLPICVMTSYVGGFRSPYYSGLMLVLFGGAVLVPVRWKQHAFIQIGVLVIYWAINIFPHPNLVDIKTAVASTYFIFWTCALSTASAFFYERLQRKEFRGRRKLESSLELVQSEKKIAEDAKQYAEEQRMIADQANRELESSLTMVQSEKQIAEVAKQYAEEQRMIADQANRAKSMFLVAANHDLRQPAHAINLFVGGLRDDLRSTEHEYAIEHAYMSVVALNQMCDHLLDLSLVDAGALKPLLRNMSLATLLSEIENDCAPLAREKNLNLSLPSNVPFVYSDPRILTVILRNLVQNAIKFTAQGRVSIEVHVDGKAVRICVSDTGIGIAEEDQSRIFMEFVQIDNPERDRNKGVGLGLASVRRRCELLGYNYGVQSMLGLGSRFHIDVPRADGVDIAADTPSIPKVITSLVGKTIAVVENEKVILSGMEIILARWGCHPIGCDSGEVLKERLLREHIRLDALIVDLRLRNNEDGLEVVENVRMLLNINLPALVITGDTAWEKLQSAHESGIHVIHKPITPDTLREKLSSVIL